MSALQKLVLGKVDMFELQEDWLPRLKYSIFYTEAAQPKSVWNSPCCITVSVGGKRVSNSIYGVTLDLEVI